VTNAEVWTKKRSKYFTPNMLAFLEFFWYYTIMQSCTQKTLLTAFSLLFYNNSKTCYIPPSDRDAERCAPKVRRAKACLIFIIRVTLFGVGVCYFGSSTRLRRRVFNYPPPCFLLPKDQKQVNFFNEKQLFKVVLYKKNNCLQTVRWTEAC